MLVVFGRYTGKGAAAVKVAGTLAGEKKDFVTDVNFTENDTKNEFIPRLWATRRVGWLLDEIRKNGETAELKEEVVRLARQNGIVTPYTAYLILEDEQRRGVPLASRTLREFEQDTRARDAAKSVYDGAVAESRGDRYRSGDLAVANADNLQRLKDSENLPQSAQEFGLQKGGSFDTASAGAGYGGGGRGFGGASGPTAAAGEPAAPATPAAKPGETLTLRRAANGTLTLGAASTLATDPQDAKAQGYYARNNYAQQARVIAGRAFYQNGNTWSDSTAATKPDLKRREVKFNSDEYFTLLQEHPEATAWFSLGAELDLVLGDTLVIVR